MEDNIPFGYNDDGKSDVRRLSGTSLGFRNFQTKKLNERREEKEWRDSLKNFPATIDEADALGYKIRQNPKAYNFENFTRDNDSTEYDSRNT